jgi:hypothetical protein
MRGGFFTWLFRGTSMTADYSSPLDLCLLLNNLHPSLGPSPQTLLPATRYFAAVIKGFIGSIFTLYAVDCFVLVFFTRKKISHSLHANFVVVWVNEFCKIAIVNKLVFRRVVTEHTNLVLATKIVPLGISIAHHAIPADSRASSSMFSWCQPSYIIVRIVPCCNTLVNTSRRLKPAIMPEKHPSFHWGWLKIQT